MSFIVKQTRGFVPLTNETLGLALMCFFSDVRLPLLGIQFGQNLGPNYKVILC